MGGGGSGRRSPLVGRHIWPIKTRHPADSIRDTPLTISQKVKKKFCKNKNYEKFEFSRKIKKSPKILFFVLKGYFRKKGSMQFTLAIYDTGRHPSRRPDLPCEGTSSHICMDGTKRSCSRET